jgi:hypothetical protein
MNTSDMTTFGRWVVGIIVVIIIAIGILAFTATNKTPAPSTGSTATTTTTAPANTYGMSEYTDPTYGFSFWYPSALTVTASTTNDTQSFPGGVAVETIQVGPAGGVSIEVVNSPNSTITDEPSNHASPIGQTKYFYDDSSNAWMVAYPDSAAAGDARATTTADTSKTTIGDVPMLPSGRRFDTTILPLSTTQFLVIGDGGGSSFTSQLAQTVTQSSSPVDPAAQATALQAEATAYNNSK